MSFLRTLCVIGLLLGTTLWANVGKVALLKGEAVAMRNAQTITLQNGSIIEDKDAIKTGKEAQIQLLFEDKTVITLGSESELAIAEYLNDETNPKAKFQFNQGTFKTITGNIGKIAPANFSLETKTSTIGIRGTIIKGVTGDEGDTIACLRGRIFVISRDTGKIVEVPAGQFTTVKPKQAPSTPKETTSEATGEPLVQSTAKTSEPAAVSTVEQTKNGSIVQNIYMIEGLRTGTLALQGLTTSDNSNIFSYDLEFSINRATAQTTGAIKYLNNKLYSLATPSNGLTQSSTVEGFTIVSYIDTSTYDEAQDYAPNFAYYYNDDVFLRAGFISSNGSRKGYFGSANLDSLDQISSVDSQYVTWGSWGVVDYYGAEINSLEQEQYWVAGSTLTDPNTLLALNSNTVYSFNGKVLGKTYNGTNYAMIDSATSNVTLDFKFGGSSSPVQTSSLISFSSNHGMWTINPAATVSAISGNTFEALGTSIVTNQALSGTSDITGRIFGTNAQAIGGVFSTSNGSIKTATGVFKAVR